MEDWLKILGTEIAYGMKISPFVLLLLGTSGTHITHGVYLLDALLKRTHDAIAYF